MTASYDERSLFLAALALPRGDREAFLDGACELPEQRRRIESLLRHHEEGTIAFLQEQDEQFGGTSAEPEPPFDLDEFHITRELGRGGMGIVYLAQDTVLKRDVAIKILSPSLARSARLLASFQQEAVHVSRLSHPAIVQVHRFGRADGLHFIVSQYVKGSTLRALIDARVAEDREGGSTAESDRAWTRQCVMVLATIAEALDQAHHAGIIHRDIKPSNIMRAEDGAARLLDFGIAIRSAASPLLAPPIDAGSVSYMSPEHAQVEGVEIDGRSDVFSLGVVLYEVLTGTLPFQGKDQAQVLEAIEQASPTPVRRKAPSVPKDLEVICHKALEKDPADRYQSAAHLGADLRCWLRGAPILARPEPLLDKARRQMRAHRSMAASIAAILLSAGGAAALATHLADTRPRVRIGNIPPGATLLVQEVDLETGLVRQAGRAVDEIFRIEPGYYRITVTGQSGESAEITQLLVDGASIDLTVNPSRPADVSLDMVLFDPIGNPVLPAAPRAYRDLLDPPPGPYLIDRYEVSNGEYEAFVLASGQSVPSPPLWEGRRCPPDMRDLPVVGVTLAEAQAYARWRGKRLPTAAEWLYAARAQTGRLYPRGSDPQHASGLGVSFVDRRAIEMLASIPVTSPAARNAYLRHVLPVRGPLPPENVADVTPEGMYFMYGNVREWTESIPYHDGVANYAVRYTCGHAWEMPSFLPSTLPGRSIPEQPVTDRLTGLGFRCAKSLSP
ncbi:MAG: bifunctional serine/threonine-protein kinase/formylglycine-generating enzyme family protein [Phycisphaerales bacterium JB060]